jgi:hypothetical protein
MEKEAERNILKSVIFFPITFFGLYYYQNAKTTLARVSVSYFHLKIRAESEFLNFERAQESISRNQFRHAVV